MRSAEFSIFKDRDGLVHRRIRAPQCPDALRGTPINGAINLTRTWSWSWRCDYGMNRLWRGFREGKAPAEPW